jgi:type IV secretory pathway component VirB8
MFDTSKEAQNFQELFFPQNSPVARIISKQSISASSMMRYPYSDSGGRGRIQLTVEQPDAENKRRVVNINYEFDFTDWVTFGNELKKVPEIGKYCDRILKQFLEAI